MKLISTVAEATHLPELAEKVAGEDLEKAWRATIRRFNAGGEVAVKYGLKDRSLRTGQLQELVEADPDGVRLSTYGDYPSACTVLIVVPLHSEPSERVLPSCIYHPRTSLVFCHAQRERPPRHNLPQRPAFYRAVRRALAGLLEEELRLVENTFKSCGWCGCTRGRRSAVDSGGLVRFVCPRCGSNELTTEELTGGHATLKERACGWSDPTLAVRF